MDAREQMQRGGERRGPSGVEWSEDGAQVARQGGRAQEERRARRDARWREEPPLPWEPGARRGARRMEREERSVEESWQQWRDEAESGEDRPSRLWYKRGS